MIIDPEQQKSLLDRFHFLSQSSAKFRDHFFRGTSLVTVPQGHTISSEGSDCEQLTLVVSGKVRVYKLADSGREITLYRINEGDSCVLTASCIMSEMRFPAIADTESDVEAVIIPANLVQEWLTESKPWAKFIFGLISKHLAEVIALLEDVAFHHVDERVAAYLIALTTNGPTHAITHQQIAADLGTTREVISRILKNFENKGFVEGERGKLTITNLSGLQEYCH